MSKLKFYFCIVFLCMSFFSFSQNFTISGNFSLNPYSPIYSMYIDRDKIELFSDMPSLSKSYSYKLIKKDGLDFIKLSEVLPKEFSEESYTKELTTSDEILFLTCKKSKSNDILLFGSTKDFYNNSSWLVPPHFEIVPVYSDSSSCLVEKNITYSIQNLGNYDVETPWVEGATGYGIGEGFTIKSNGRKDNYLFIMNGYISYEKPYLYKQNGRIKKITVKGLKSGIEKTLNVLDTPHPQTVDISFLPEDEDIRITIADVYKGTKYEDTCINFLIPYMDEVIPFVDRVQ